MPLPVSHTFPHSSYQSRCHEIVEETLQDQRRALQVIAVDVDAHKAADGAAGRNNQQPVPLPSAPDRLPPPLQRQIPLPVFPQAPQGKQDRGREHGCEGDPELPVPAHVLDGRVAGGGVDEGPVQEHVRLEDAEREPAVRPVREGPVRVQGVVVVVERGPVEVDIVDDYVCVVLAWLERDELPDGNQ